MAKVITDELEFKDIGKLMFRYFWPAFIGVSANALYNITDRIFIGRGVGAFALSGLSVVFPIMILVAAFGMLIGIGAGVRISINLGKKDHNQAEKVLGNGVTLMIIVSVVVTIIGFLVKTPLLESFGATVETIGHAQDYLNIILPGVIFQIVGFSLNNIIRSEGNARIAMYSMLISAGANILLDPIFIFVLDMGVKGAAIATVISQFILCVWVFRHFISSRAVVGLKIKHLVLEPVIIGRIISIGMAPFTMQLAASLIQVVFNKQLIKYGSDVAVGAMGIINSVAILIVMTIISINMAAQPIIGYNYGAAKYSRVRKTWNIGMKAATWISVIAFVLVELFPGAIIQLFNQDNSELYQIGVRGIRIYIAMLPIVGWQIITSNYFQSIGKAKISLFLTLMRQVIVLLPLLFIFPGIFGLDGIWLAGPVSDFASACVVFVFYKIERKKLRKLENSIEDRSNF